MQMRLRPELVLRLLQVAGLRTACVGETRRAIDLGDIAGTPAAGLVDDVDRVAAPREILRPALAPVGRAREGRARAAAAMHHHDRVGMRLLLRNAHLDIHLPDHVALAIDGHGLAAHRKEAVTRQVERRVLIHGLCGPAGQERQDRARDECGSGNRDKRKSVLIHVVFLPLNPSYYMQDGQKGLILTVTLRREVALAGAPRIHLASMRPSLEGRRPGYCRESGAVHPSRPRLKRPGSRLRMTGDVQCRLRYAKNVRESEP
jgi:hypothetical protein